MKNFLVIMSVVLGMPIFLLFSGLDVYSDLSKRAFLWSKGQSTLASGSSELSPVQEVEQENAPMVITEITNSYEVSGSEAGEAGYGLDVMKLIKYTSPQSKEAQKYKELIELYYSSSKGELDSASEHLTPQTYAAIHRNETSDATFLDGYYGKAMGSYSATDMTLSHFTGEMMKQLAIDGSGGVFKDANQDGFPDGPFQIEKGKTVDFRKKSNRNGKGHTYNRDFDIVYFPDQLSWLNYNFSELVAQYSMQQVESSELSMLAAVQHNRGSIARQAFGMPYNTKGLDPVDNYIKATNADFLREASVLFRDLNTQFQKIRPAIKGTDHTSQNALAVFLALKAGWFIDSEMGNLSNVVDKSQSIAYFKQIFPEASNELPSEYLNSRYVKKPWEVVGITKEEYGAIYGMNRNKYSDYYPYTFLFKVENYTSSCYINKMPDGSAPNVVHAWDYLPLGHCVASGILGEYILLDMFVKAGIPSEIDGVAVDPSNPQLFYSDLNKNNPYSYNPSNNSNIADCFNQLLGILNVSANQARLKSLYHTYENLGMKYWYGGGGIQILSENYKEHSRFLKENSIKGISAQFLLDHYFYQVKGGEAYSHEVTKNEDLLYQGVRIFDCAKLAMCGPSLGQTRENHMYYNYNSSGILHASDKSKGEEIRTVGGVTYDTGLYIASDGAHTVAEYRDNTSLVEGGLQPGDIFVTNGHVFTFLCVSQKNTIIPADIARSGTDVAVSTDSLVTLEAWQTGEYNRIRDRGWSDSRKYYIVRVHMFDS